MSFATAFSTFGRMCIRSRVANLTFMRKFTSIPPRPSFCRTFASSSRPVSRQSLILVSTHVDSTSRILGVSTSKSLKGISFQNSFPTLVAKRLFAAPSRKQLQDVSTLFWLLNVRILTSASAYNSIWKLLTGVHPATQCNVLLSRYV